MEPLHWLFLALAVFVVLSMVLKRLFQVSPEKARELLASGALVIDVCTTREFSARHVKGARNIPLDQLRKRIGKIAPDRNRPLLVYCHSGSRSAFACRILTGLGYKEVHNLGSFSRARSILAKG